MDRLPKTLVMRPKRNYSLFSPLCIETSETDSRRGITLDTTCEIFGTNSNIRVNRAY